MEKFVEKRKTVRFKAQSFSFLWTAEPENQVFPKSGFALLVANLSFYPTAYVLRVHEAFEPEEGAVDELTLKK